MRRDKHVTMVHKANVLKVTDGLFVRLVLEVADAFPEVRLDEMLVDAMAARLIREPEAFDVIVTTNMYGDILSDEAAALYQFAVDHGIDRDAGPTEGLVFDSLLCRGVDLDDNKRLWGQTEALKAHTARLEFTGDEAARALLDAQLEHLFACHLLDQTGLWREHLARDGAALRDSAPATSLYHLFLALSEVLRVRDGITDL